MVALFDLWLVVLLVFAALVSCGLLPILRFYAPGTHPGPKWMSFIAWTSWPPLSPHCRRITRCARPASSSARAGARC